MKYTFRTIIVLLFFSALATSAKAQYTTPFFKHEVGLGLGTTYYNGDFVPYEPFTNPSFYGVAFYRYAFNKNLSVRAQIGGGNLKGSSEDYRATLPGITNPPLEFNRNFFLGEGLLEFNFLPYNPVYQAGARKTERFTPFLALGLGCTYLSTDKSFVMPVGQDAYLNEAKPVFNIPLGIGIKWSPASQWTISAEWFYKVAFYDGIDLFAPRDNQSAITKNDKISTLGVTVAYRFVNSQLCPSLKMRKVPKRDVQGIWNGVDDKRTQSQVKKRQNKASKYANEYRQKQYSATHSHYYGW